MQHVLTLVTDPDDADLDTAMAAEAAGVLRGLGAVHGPVDWLCEDVACDIPFSGLPPLEARAAVRERLQGWPVDVIAQPAAGRRKRLLVADMDSTVVVGETLDDLAAFAGVQERIKRITERAMNGEVGFRGALVERVALLKGLPVDALDATLREVRLTPGARTLVRTMKAHGAYTALVSGGFTVFTRAVAAICGFDFERGNELEIADGRLTGRVIEPIVNKNAKLETLTRLAGERCIALGEAVTVGDGANDLPMIKAAGLGVAFRAKPVVRTEARHSVEHGDLTALLYAQGYHRDQFAEDQSSG